MTKIIKLFFLFCGVNNITESMENRRNTERNTRSRDETVRNTDLDLIYEDMGTKKRRKTYLDLTDEDIGALSLVDPENQNVFKEVKDNPYFRNIYEKNQKLYVTLPKIFTNKKEDKSNSENNEFFDFTTSILAFNLKILSKNNMEIYKKNLTYTYNGIKKYFLNSNINEAIKSDILDSQYLEFKKESIRETEAGFIFDYMNQELKKINKIYEKSENLNKLELTEEIEKFFIDIFIALIKNIKIIIDVDLLDILNKDNFSINDKKYKESLDNFSEIFNLITLVNNENEIRSIDKLKHNMNKILHFFIEPVLNNGKNIEHLIHENFIRRINVFLKKDWSGFDESFKDLIENISIKIADIFENREKKNHELEIILNENSLNESMKKYPRESSIFLSQILIFSKVFNTTITIPDEYEIKINKISNPDGLFDSNAYINTYYNFNLIKEEFKTKAKALNVFYNSKNASSKIDWLINNNASSVVICKGGLSMANMQLAALLSSQMIEDKEKKTLKFIDDDLLVKFWVTNFNDVANFKKDSKLNVVSSSIRDIFDANVEVLVEKKSFIDKMKKALNTDVREIFKKKEVEGNFRIKDEKENAKLSANMENFKIEASSEKEEKNILRKMLDLIPRYFKKKEEQKADKNSNYNKQHYNYGIFNDIDFRFTIEKLFKDDKIKLTEEFIKLIPGLFDIKEIALDNLEDVLSPLLVICALNSPSLTDVKLGLLTETSIDTLTKHYGDYKKHNKNNNDLLLNNSIQHMELSFEEDIFANRDIHDKFEKFFLDFVLDLTLRSRIESEGNVEIKIILPYKDKIDSSGIINEFRDIFHKVNHLDIYNNKINDEVKDKKLDKKSDKKLIVEDKKQIFDNYLNIKIHTISKEENTSTKETLSKEYKTLITVM